MGEVLVELPQFFQNREAHVNRVRGFRGAAEAPFGRHESAHLLVEIRNALGKRMRDEFAHYERVVLGIDGIDTRHELNWDLKETRETAR